MIDSGSADDVYRVQNTLHINFAEILNRLKSNNKFGKNHVFQSPKDLYRKIYFEIFDQVLMSLKSRFETDSS